MALFNCKVMTPQGQITNVKIEETDKINALKKLKRNGMTPIEIKESYLIKNDNKKKITATIYSKKKRFKLNIDKIVNLKNRVTLAELKDFTKSFYLLKKSNFTESHSLSTLINNTKNEYLKKALREVLVNYDKGTEMYKTMKEFPDIFPVIYINFIKTGELTNSLETSLKYAVAYLEDEETIRSKVNNTIIPNLFMFFGIILVIFIALLIGVPNLQNTIISNGGVGNVPKTTLLISTILGGFVHYWYVFVIIIAVMLSIIIIYINTDEGKEDLDNLKYKNPLFGKTAYLLDFTRVIRSVYLNLQNNMRVQDALEISKNVTKNVQMHIAIEKAINNLYVGKSWLDTFEEDNMLNTVSIELLKKGFKNKSIEIIDRAINYLDKEIENSVNLLLKRILEISYLIIGIALILFILIVFIPYIQIYLSELLFL